MAESGCKLFVGCLPYSKTEADLTPLFDQYGPVEEVALLRKPDGSSKGAAFVIYQNPENAKAALTNLQNYAFPGSNRGMNISISGTKVGGTGGQHVGQSVPPPQRGRPSVKAERPVMPPSYPPFSPFQHQGAYANQPAPPPGSPSSGTTAPGTKIFIGQLPYSKGEHELQQLFGSIGPIAEVVLMKNSQTGESKGAAFVRYHSPQHAAAACAALDGFTFTGSSRPITVSIAQSDGTGQKRGASTQNPAALIASLGTQAPGAAMLPGGHGHHGAAPARSALPEVEGAKLFVGQLPFSRSEVEIKEVFQQYGPVAEVFLHRDAQGQKKGACFVRYMDADHANAALEMDGYMFQGATRPITVFIAGEGPGAKKQRFA